MPIAPRLRTPRSPLSRRPKAQYGYRAKHLAPLKEAPFSLNEIRLGERLAPHGGSAKVQVLGSIDQDGPRYDGAAVARGIGRAVQANEGAWPVDDAFGGKVEVPTTTDVKRHSRARVPRRGPDVPIDVDQDVAQVVRVRIKHLRLQGRSCGPPEPATRLPDRRCTAVDVAVLLSRRVAARRERGQRGVAIRISRIDERDAPRRRHR